MALLVSVAFALVGVALGERSVAVGFAGMWRGRLLRGGSASMRRRM